jgi:hypothetical protein
MRAVGYRYGEARGCSYNTRDNHSEAGVSLASIGGLPEIWSFAVAGAAHNRKKYYYSGDVLMITGGDDEPLMDVDTLISITPAQYRAAIKSTRGRRSRIAWLSRKYKTAIMLANRGYAGYDKIVAERLAVIRAQ